MARLGGVAYLPPHSLGLRRVEGVGVLEQAVERRHLLGDGRAGARLEVRSVASTLTEA
jgi:hypothetical protein